MLDSNDARVEVPDLPGAMTMRVSGLLQGFPWEQAQNCSKSSIEWCINRSCDAARAKFALDARTRVAFKSGVYLGAWRRASQNFSVAVTIGGDNNIYM